MREVNRLGVTGVIDAGGGLQNYPEDYQIIEELHREGKLTIRIAYNLFTQKPKQELQDFAAWAKQVKPGQGDDMYRNNGAGEMLVYSAADFEDFRVERPDMPPSMEGDLEARRSRCWRRTAGRGGCMRPTTRRSRARSTCSRRSTGTYRSTACTGSSIMRRRSMIAISTGSPSSAVASRCSTAWLTRASISSNATATARPNARHPFGACWKWACRSAPEPMRRAWPHTIRGFRSPGSSPARHWAAWRIYPAANRLDRETALRLWTEANAWFSTETGKKGQIKEGQLADLAVLSDDYFSVPEDAIQDITSVLTIVGGKAVAWGRRLQGLRRRYRHRCRTGRRSGFTVATEEGGRPQRCADACVHRQLRLCPQLRHSRPQTRNCLDR